jgi:hypothetical protein
VDADDVDAGVRPEGGRRERGLEALVGRQVAAWRSAMISVIRFV